MAARSRADERRSHVDPLGPANARDIAVAVLRRAIHGPTSADDTRWPGNTRSPIIVSADQSFSDWTALNEALIDEAGNEVLTMDPTNVYGVGVLFPILTGAEEDELTAQQTAFEEDAGSEGSDLAEPPAELVPEPDASPGEPEDSVKVPSGGNRPRSLALSFHIPASVATINVTLTGGRYKRLPIVISGNAVDVWQRVPIEDTITLDATTSNTELRTFDAVAIQVGLQSHATTAEGRLVTVHIANVGKSDGDAAPRCLFQSQITILTPNVLAYPTAGAGGEDDASLDLLYRNHPVRAVGHATDATASFDEESNRWVLRSETVPSVSIPNTTPDVTGPDGQRYAVGMNDLAEMNPEAVDSVNRILTDYEKWIQHQELYLSAILDPRLQLAGVANLQACRDFLEDMKEGWICVRSEPDVQQIFQWTSDAMGLQRRSSSADTRPTVVLKNGNQRTETVEGSSPHLRAESKQAFWRPFQIAFLLGSIPAAINPSHPKRDHVDIIWMPTGGGKTEAYLGLAAFTMLWERTREIQSGQTLRTSVSVLMRYTLRLLTAQQVQRASALICSLEMLRARHPAALGDKPFRIGAYLGRAATPNSCKDAVRLWGNLDRNASKEGNEGGLLLARCPWCAAQMGPVEGGVAGYKKVTSRVADGGVRIQACCPDVTCPFSFSGNPAKPRGLPVLEVDEDIYRGRPSFIVGTIDKFAQLAWRSDTRALFGLASSEGKVHRSNKPPSLFIQDELHLIAGPLGSLDALYEVALEELCTFDGGRRPRIIAATATTKSYTKQVLRLYGRSNSRLIPPPGLSIEDSFFARVDHNKPGKTYVGVCAPGYGSNVQAQLRTLAALLHAGGTLDTIGIPSDPWWSNLVFFSSRRSLGLQLAASDIGLRNAAHRLSQISGLRVGRLTEEGTRLSRRDISTIKELTATSRDNVAQVLDQLGQTKNHKKCIDLCFATSMIEVGVDVPRLGLMTVMSQPKSYSQYIQVTGRVGRTDDAPGLVVVVLSPHAVRDRSHYETFTTTHQRLYSSVEPVSVTPFTPQALERGLAGALTSTLRNTHDVEDPTPLVTPSAISSALAPWRERATKIGGGRNVLTLDEEGTRLAQLAAAASQDSPHLQWGDLRSNSEYPLLTSLGATSNETAYKTWAVPLSMRSVDSETAVRVVKGSSSPPAQPAERPVSNAAELADDEGADL